MKKLLCLLGLLSAVFAAADSVVYPVEVEPARVICREKGRYIGWPSVACLRDGTLVAVFSGNRMGHICPSGVVQVVRSVDLGKTWSSPVTIGDTPIDDRDASIHQLPDGEILVTWFTSIAYTSPYWRKIWRENRDQESLGAFCGRWCVRSKNGGLTWSNPERMPIVGSAPHGGTVLKDGSLLAVGRWTPGGNGEATNSKDFKTEICCERSTDGGRTWQMLCERFPDMNDEGQAKSIFHEPHVAELPDGRLVALIRYHGEDECFRQSESTDGGRNWTPMRKTDLKAGRTPAHLTALPDGRLVAVYGIRRFKSWQAVGEYAAVSSDGGRTWSAVDGICLFKSKNKVAPDAIGYAASALLPDGSLYTVFYEPETDGGKRPVLMGVRWRLTGLDSQSVARWR